jgi:hypothetical protein
MTKRTISISSQDQIVVLVPCTSHGPYWPISMCYPLHRSTWTWTGTLTLSRNRKMSYTMATHKNAAFKTKTTNSNTKITAVVLFRRGLRVVQYKKLVKREQIGSCYGGRLLILWSVCLPCPGVIVANQNNEVPPRSIPWHACDSREIRSVRYPCKVYTIYTFLSYCSSSMKTIDYRLKQHRRTTTGAEGTPPWRAGNEKLLLSCSHSLDSRVYTTAA